MSWLITLLRRVLWLALLCAIAGAVYGWWRERNEPPSPAPPQWPPLDPDAAPAGVPAREPKTPAAATTPPPAPTPTPDPAPDAAAATGDSTATASVVNALVDAPDARANGGDTWVEPNDDGSCPASHPIKANDNSGIFHVPGGRFYDRTGAERCYRTAEDATADGYRQSKS